jgi:hypothetical protein
MHPTGGSLRVFRHFSGFEFFSAPKQSPRSAHKQVNVKPLGVCLAHQRRFLLVTSKYIKKEIPHRNLSPHSWWVASEQLNSERDRAPFYYQAVLNSITF